MRTNKICFFGRHNLPSHCWRNLRYRLERARPGELEGFEQQTKLVRTRRPQAADVIYARNCPEKTTDRGLARLQKLIDRVDDGSRLVINPQKNFQLIDSKDRTFTTWENAGVSCPRHWQLDTDHDDPHDTACLDQILQLLDRHERVLLRTNNECASNGLRIVDRGMAQDDVVSVLSELKRRAARLRRKRRETRTIAVEYADTRDSEGFAILARVFVLLDRIIGYFAAVSNQFTFRVDCMGPESYDRFIDANLKLRSVVEEPRHRAEILRAVTSLRNNVGAVEFMLPSNGDPVFLEINTHWGGVPSRYSFGNDEFTALVEQRESHWSKLVPNIDQNLRTTEFYRDMYQYIADYHQREQTYRAAPLTQAAA